MSSSRNEVWRNEVWGWQWPEKGRDPCDFVRQINDIRSPYEGDQPAMCYPGTPLNRDTVSVVEHLVSKQINNIGSHTHRWKDQNGNLVFRLGEGGFEALHRMEAEAIWMIASMLGGAPETIDGYFCGGGTEANIEGLWIGREYLRQELNNAPKHDDIVVLTTPLAHYSIFKAIEMLDMGHHEWENCKQCGKNHVFVADKRGYGLNFVGMDGLGQMLISDLERVFASKYRQGFRRFLIAPTVGTCLMGSIDPIRQVGQFTKEAAARTKAKFYIHVDASFAGFTIPFVNPGLQIGFPVPEVNSVTVDPDKMGQLPYPAGVFLCRKDLMSLVARKVNYVRGNEDDTVCGSRSCIAPVLAWYLYQTEGQEGQRRYVQKCLDARYRLVEMVQKELDWVKILPYSPWVNFAPMEIDIENGAVPEELKEDGILAPYHLRSDFLPGNPTDITSCPRVVYKICVMPHHNETHFRNFINDLKKAKLEWR